MERDNVTRLSGKEETCDPLHDIIRSGARELLAQAITAEVDDFLAAHVDQRLEDGRARLVRHGFLPARTLQTGVGPVEISKPRIRDRGMGGDKINWNSKLLPSYLRRSKSLDELLPALYLRGVSSGDFQKALAALLGKDAPNLSPQTISRLKAGWQQELQAWQKRDLSARNYVYIWADGIYLQPRKDDRMCILVLLGATPEGKKELIGFVDGYRESTQSWKELLLELKARGLRIDPKLAIGDGALGFWAALKDVFEATKGQRCWVHKTANVVNRVPKAMQAKVKSDLQDIWMAETRADAIKAFDLFLDKYRDKYDKATECLEKDRKALLAFYDFPAAHWKHIRTTNPIESIFASVRHRTKRSKGCLSRKTAMPMIYKLIMAASSRWQKLNGTNLLPKLLEGVIFEDGEQLITETKPIAA